MCLVCLRSLREAREAGAMRGGWEMRAGRQQGPRRASLRTFGGTGGAVCPLSVECAFLRGWLGPMMQCGQAAVPQPHLGTASAGKASP